MSSHSSNERHCSLCHIVTKYRKESQKIIENAKINRSLNKQVSFTSTPICETPQGKEFYRSNNVRPLALGNQLFFLKAKSQIVNSAGSKEFFAHRHTINT